MQLAKAFPLQKEGLGVLPSGSVPQVRVEDPTHPVAGASFHFGTCAL